VREDVDVVPTLPDGTHSEMAEGQLTLAGEQLQAWTTVAEALADLPAPTDDGTVPLPPLSEFPDNDYLPLVRDGASETWNHVANAPADDEDTRHIVDELRPGEMYRSSRFGDRYRQVWDVLGHRFSGVERDVLHFIARHRTRKEYRMYGSSVGPVPDTRIAGSLDHDDDAVLEALDSLYEGGWIRSDEEDGVTGYDLNTKSGIRPRYMRLDPTGQSNTILTTDFNPRDKLHPTENRGLSLREGARIQSFPDSFRFRGSFDEIAGQIGNAVPPLLAWRLGEHLHTLSAQQPTTAPE
jgi:hypothetical protein